MERVHRGRAFGGAGRKRGLAAAASVFAIAVSISGCALFFKSPEVYIADVRVVSVTLVGGTAEVSLNVVNPNGFTLTAREVRYRLSFEDAQAEEGWRTLTQGATENEIAVAAKDSSAVRLAVPFLFADVGRALGSLLSQGELRYRLDGDVKFDAPLRDVRIPFDRRGSFAP